MSFWCCRLRLLSNELSTFLVREFELDIVALRFFCCVSLWANGLRILELARFEM